MCLLKLYLVTRDKRIDKYQITGKHNTLTANLHL